MLRRTTPSLPTPSPSPFTEPLQSFASSQEYTNQSSHLSDPSFSSPPPPLLFFLLLLVAVVVVVLWVAMDSEISEEYAEIASDYDDEAAHARAAPGRHQRPHPSKPNKGTRFLVVLLQALVMAVALFLFFLFAGIAAVVLLHLFVAGRSLRRRRRRLGAAGAAGAVGGLGLSPEELRLLPTCRFSGKGRVDSADCAVCLEEIRVGERCRVLQACGHEFHKACVDKWLARAPACPVCRASVRA